MPVHQRARRQRGSDACSSYVGRCGRGNPAVRIPVARIRLMANRPSNNFAVCPYCRQRHGDCPEWLWIRTPIRMVSERLGENIRRVGRI